MMREVGGGDRSSRNGNTKVFHGSNKEGQE